MKTKRPMWSVTTGLENGRQVVAIKVDGRVMASAHPDWTEDVQRAVDCVNALAGVVDPQTVVSDLASLADAALRLCKRIPQGHSGERVELESFAKAALKKAGIK